MRYEESTFETTGGLRLFGRAWLPDGAARADVAIVHGYAEHSGRYEHAGAYLAARGYAVWALDLRGHGKSEGDRVLVRSFNEYLDDVEALLAQVRARGDETRPLFLFGHSMGGAIAALAVVSRRPRIDGLLLSGAAIAVPSGAARLLTPIIQFLGRRWPKLGLRTLPSDGVSRPGRRGRLRRRSAELSRQGAGPGRRTVEGVGHDRTPYTADRHAVARHAWERGLAGQPGREPPAAYRATSPDKTLSIYEGLYHEILNEPERDTVLGDMAAWLDAHTEPVASRMQADAAG